MKTTPIGFSIRSILFAWIRSLCIVIGVLGGCAVLGATILALQNQVDKSSFLLVLLTTTAAFAVFGLPRRCEWASFERSRELAVRAGFPPDAIGELLDVESDRGLQIPDQDAGLVPCPSCGRKLSPSTRICPRCEHRQG